MFDPHNKKRKLNLRLSVEEEEKIGGRKLDRIQIRKPTRKKMYKTIIIFLIFEILIAKQSKIK